MKLTNHNHQTKMETCSITITRMHARRFIETTDQLAVEEPLQIQLLYGPSGNEQLKNVTVTMRTPGNDEELAAGFLFTEGIIRNNSQLTQIIAGASGENTVLVILKGNYIPDLQTSERNFYVTSSCGVCGKSSLDAVRRVIDYPLSNEQVRISASVLYRLPEALRKQQEVFQSTGGLHACALFDDTGDIISLREDIGRHNALDKLIGDVFLKEQLPLQNKILLLSGRASFELVQKAAVAGIRIVAAIGAPSSLAVQLAEEVGITLVGFLKRDGFNIYSGPERITETVKQT
jgi:FdhD protein